MNGASAGLYYNRARWYDANTGRFLSEDPLEFEGGDANLYRYAAGDPVNFLDPTGQSWLSSLFKKIGKAFKKTLDFAENVINNPDDFIDNLDEIGKGLIKDPLFWVGVAGSVWGFGPLFNSNLTWGAFEVGVGTGGVYAGPNWGRALSQGWGALTGRGFSMGVPTFNVATPVFSMSGQLWSQPAQYAYAGNLARPAEAYSSTEAVPPAGVAPTTGASTPDAESVVRLVAYEDEGYQSVTGQAALGVVQGGANTVNGVQDAALGIANIGLHLSPLTHLYEWWYNTDVSITSPDWSRDLFVYESDLTHGISKFVGGESAITLGTFGATQVRHAEKLRYLSPVNSVKVQRAERYSEYMRFRSQGFNPAQSKYLTEPYTGAGHHFPIPQRLGKQLHLSESVVDNSLNVLKPSGINRGRFYELHYFVDPSWKGTAFPRAIGGSWSGKSLGLERYGTAGQIWHGTSSNLRVTVGAGGGAVGGASSWINHVIE